MDLPLFEQQPEQAVPLVSHSGEPLWIEVFRIHGELPFRRVDLRLRNHSNKDIRQVDCRMDYLDSTGEVVKHHSAVIFPPPSLEPNRAPTLITNKTVKVVEQTAFFTPDDLKEVQVTLEKVHFVDNTFWP